MASKILIVFGATGNQGGSVIESVLADPRAAKEFKIRGITRDPSKGNAKALEAKGVEMVSVSITSILWYSWPWSSIVLSGSTTTG